MRCLHLSDLHFGTESEAIVADLMESITSIKPDLILISGDFVQIANRIEFQKAADFIKRLPAPVFCIPGNHDIPRYHWLERFFAPYRKYKNFINPNIQPILKNDQLILVGLNTARRVLPHWNWANGAISKAQLRHLKKSVAYDGGKYRICMMHHPIHKADKAPLKVKVFGAHAAMRAMNDLKIDLVLTGHVHHASITVVEKTVFASASTAISHRTRAQANGFNVIDFYPDYFVISHYEYNDENFIQASTHRHEKNR